MHKNILRTFTLLIALMLIFVGLAGCSSGDEDEATAAPTQAEVEATKEDTPTEVPATAVPEPEEATSIVIVIPEDPPSFNGIVTDTGYEQMAMKLVLLGMAAVDENSEPYPILAAELPTGGKWQRGGRRRRLDDGCHVDDAR